MRVLGLSYDTLGKLSKDFRALEMYRSAIVGACAVDLDIASATSTPQAVQAVADYRPDALLLCPKWHTDPTELETLIAAIREAGSFRIGLVDFCDGTSTPFLRLLTQVDLIIKAHALRNPAAYQRQYVGGYIFTDYLATQLGWDIGDWSFGSIIDSGQAYKVVPGWTWAVANRYRSLSTIAARVPVPWSLRRIDINTRFGGVDGGDDWYRMYRKYTHDKVHELAGEARLSSNKRVGRKRYLVEMKFTRIALSPFGWGEVCFRDFEAIACGALLVKPDMSHVQTHPDLYRPFETYIPVKWDLSDLHEKCRYYLQSPQEAQRIASLTTPSVCSYSSSGRSDLLGCSVPISRRWKHLRPDAV